MAGWGAEGRLLVLNASRASAASPPLVAATAMYPSARVTGKDSEHLSPDASEEFAQLVSQRIMYGVPVIDPSMST